MTKQRMRLEVTQFDDIDHWRWTLTDDGGAFKADHAVALERTDPEYDAFVNLYHQVQWKKVPDRPMDSEREIIERLGRWVGEKVLGPIGPKLVTEAPVTVEVHLPEQAAGLLYRPFELATVDNKPLALQDVTLVYKVREGDPAKRKRAIEERLRMLAVFSLPTDVSALSLRRERHALKKLIRSMVQTKKRAIELRIVQYGVTRDRLEAVLEEGEGWDLIHFSGHGLPAGLLLEQPDGKKDLVSTEKLQKLLRGTRDRLKLIMLSTCKSAAPTLRETLQWLHIDETPHEEATTDAQAEEKNLPALAKNLAETLDCAVLAMRYPVGDDFAVDLAHHFYDLVLAKQNDVPRALQRALPKALPDNPHPGASPISVTVPALFGTRATDLALEAPRRSQAEVETPMAHFPPENEYFVGRVGPMARASMLMAEESDHTGVLFHGMAGAGKTACALELAYRYEHDRFEHLVWHKAPEEGRAIETALSALAHDMEQQIPGLAMAHVIDRIDEFADWLPTLSERLKKQSILIVLDNLESLLTEGGQWRDARWGRLIQALLLHDGFSRTVLTSRRRPTELGQAEKNLQVEAIHALSSGESILLARQLPHLGRLLRGETELDIEAGRALVKRALVVVQGHPKLMDFAEALAKDPEILAVQLDQAEGAWAGGEGQLQAFFREGESQYEAQDFLAALDSWTLGIANSLSKPAQTVFYILCVLEEVDREMWVVKAIWEYFWQELEPSSQAPDLKTLLDELRAVGLVEMQLFEDKKGVFTLHPGVAEAGRREAGETFQANVDNVMGNFLGALGAQAFVNNGMGGQITSVRKVFLHTVPYLIRRRDWHRACAVLDFVFYIDRSPTTATKLLSWLRQVVTATEGTDEALSASFSTARALYNIGHVTEAEELFRHALKKAQKQGDYKLASAATSSLIKLLIEGGHTTDAYDLVEDLKEYTRQAGLGPWTQLANEGQRLNILNLMRRNNEALEAVGRLREEMLKLPKQLNQEEVHIPADVYEYIVDLGRHAAQELGDWDQALSLNAEKLENMKRRDALARDQMLSRLNDYYPIIMLSKNVDAHLKEVLLKCSRRLLKQARRSLENERCFSDLGKFYGSLAHSEAASETPDLEAVLRFQKTSLRYVYIARDSQSCAAGHYNLSHWLGKLDKAPMKTVLVHTLASGILRYQMESGDLERLLVHLNNLIAVMGQNPPLPESFDQLADIVERVDGVRFRELFHRLPQRAESGDEALAAVLNMAAELMKKEADE